MDGSLGKTGHDQTCRQLESRSASAQHRPDDGESSVRRTDTARERLPLTRDPRQSALPHAWRRQGLGRPIGQSQCLEARALRDRDHGRTQAIP